jgi:hypothetical protein
MTVHVSAWYGVALILWSCFWLGAWARPRLVSLRRLVGGWLGRGRASGRGRAGTVERVRTYTGCSTVGGLREEFPVPGGDRRVGARPGAMRDLRRHRPRQGDHAAAMGARQIAAADGRARPDLGAARGRQADRAGGGEVRDRRRRAVRHPDESDAPILVTNYERLHLFRDHEWSALVLDESSILKSVDSKTRDDLTRWARTIRYRLCCTATPAPNDHTELGNHAEFLGVLTGRRCSAVLRPRRADVAVQHWRLKGHAHEAFWRWVASWAIAVRRPSDLGYDDDGYPAAARRRARVGRRRARPTTDRLFAVEAHTLEERREARLASTDDRVAGVRRRVIAAEPDEPWIVWCDYNRERGAREGDPRRRRGARLDPPERKEQALIDFAEGRTRVLVTKPTIAGFGLNWQHCARMAFVGLSDSYEQWYQAIRRCWRFGQERPVQVRVFASEPSGVVIENVQRKAREAEQMMEQITRSTSPTLERHATRRATARPRRRRRLDAAPRRLPRRRPELEAGASACRVLAAVPRHVRLLRLAARHGQHARPARVRPHDAPARRELLRVTMPGRTCAIHLCQTTAQKVGTATSASRTSAARDPHDGARRLDLLRRGLHRQEPAGQGDPHEGSGLLFKSLAKDSA